ncbi:hypothetical protein AAIP79_004446 [Klebsiella aerogenes]
MSYTVKALSPSSYQAMMTSLNNFVIALDDESFSENNSLKGMFGPIGLVTSLLGAGVSLFQGGKALKKSQQAEDREVTIHLHNYTNITMGIYECATGGGNPSNLIITPGKTTDITLRNFSTSTTIDGPACRMALNYPGESEQPFLEVKFAASNGFYLRTANYNDSKYDQPSPAGHQQFISGFEASSTTGMPDFYVIGSSIYDMSSGSCDLYLIQKDFTRPTPTPTPTPTPAPGTGTVTMYSSENWTGNTVTVRESTDYGTNNSVDCDSVKFSVAGDMLITLELEDSWDFSSHTYTSDQGDNGDLPSYFRAGGDSGSQRHMKCLSVKIEPTPTPTPSPTPSPTPAPTPAPAPSNAICVLYPEVSFQGTPVYLTEPGEFNIPFKSLAGGPKAIDSNYTSEQYKLQYEEYDIHGNPLSGTHTFTISTFDEYENVLDDGVAAVYAIKLYPPENP